MANAQQSKRVEVTLAKPHTHGGRDYQAGDKIEVTEAQRAWLAHPDRQVIKTKEAK